VQFTSLQAHASPQWDKYHKKVTSSPCPHCSKEGFIRRHGYLKGKDLQKPKTIKRGLRFFCSNRFNNKGCARTFSIFFDVFLPRHSVTSHYLSIFLNEALHSSSIHATWHRIKLPFSINSAYRWMKKFKQNLARIRPFLHEHYTGGHDSSTPLQQTLQLLQSTFPFCFTSQFQSVFQTSFFY